jgi:hypothetical protein
LKNYIYPSTYNDVQINIEHRNLKECKFDYSDRFYRDNNKLLTGIVHDYYYSIYKKIYVENGMIHREDGPAVMHSNNSTAFYLHNKIIGANLKQETFEKLKNIYYKELVFK